MAFMNRIRFALERGTLRSLLAILAGKALGLAAVYLSSVAIERYFFTEAHAAELAHIDPAAPYISPMNTAWTLGAAFLVFFMQAGFMCLEAGFSRAREAVNIILEGIVDTCLCGVLFWAFGFAFMFGSGNGWIGQQYFMLHDAPRTYGTTVVHTIGGLVALAGAMALGPRIGRKFKRDGGGFMPGHDMVIAAVGGLILWFGWYGFNPGSTLSAMDAEGTGRVAANTTLAACSGGLAAIAVSYPRFKIWDCGLTVNGFLAGLVSITCPCYWVTPAGALCIGAVGGVLCVFGVELIEWFRVDDPVGAVTVHGICGIWGTLSLGLFASGEFGAPSPTGADTSSTVRGLFYAGGPNQLIAQAVGSVSVTLCTFVAATVLMYLVKQTGTLRVSEAGELEGLDVHEHGGPAYPDLYNVGIGTEGLNEPQRDS